MESVKKEIEFENEVGLIQGIITGGFSALAEAQVYISDIDFSTSAHQRVFELFTLMKENNESFSDTHMLIKRLRESGLISALGGAGVFASKYVNPSATENITAYSKSVRESAVRRRLVAQLPNIQRKISAGEDCLMDIESIKSTLDEIVNRLSSDTELVTLTDVGMQRVESVTEKLNALESGVEFESDTLVKTGIEGYDKRYGGFARGESIIVAARPGMGKSALAKQIASNVSLNGGNVLFISLEMEPIEVGDRVWCERAGLDSRKMTKDDLDRNETAILSMNIEDMQGNNFLISAPVGDSASLQRILAKARLTHNTTEGGLDMIIVDYLQLIGKDNPRQSDYEIVTAASKAMKGLARELNCPVVSAAQLNRQGDQNDKPRKPKLSDLRDSGSIEQDANVVIAIHSEKTGEGMPDESWLCVLKKRNAEKVDIPVVFEGNRMVFSPDEGRMTSQDRSPSLSYEDPMREFTTPTSHGVTNF